MSDQIATESALAAMRRAADTARIRASRFGSRLALWRDGAVVLVEPTVNGQQQEDAGQRTTGEISEAGDEENPNSEWNEIR